VVQFTGYKASLFLRQFDAGVPVRDFIVLCDFCWQKHPALFRFKNR
jgi:hypothetical protein